MLVSESNLAFYFTVEVFGPVTINFQCSIAPFLFVSTVLLAVSIRILRSMR